MSEQDIYNPKQTEVEILDDIFVLGLQIGTIKLTAYMKYIHDIRKNAVNETFSEAQRKQITELLTAK